MNIRFVPLDDRGAGMLDVHLGDRHLFLERHVVDLHSGVEAWWFEPSGALLARFALHTQAALPRGAGNDERQVIRRLVRARFGK